MHTPSSHTHRAVLAFSGTQKQTLLFFRAHLHRLSSWRLLLLVILVLSLSPLPVFATTPGDLFAEGYRHLTGQGFSRDATMAARLFLEAAQAGEPQAQYQLGVMHMDGLGVPADSLWAYFWLSRAIQSPGLPGLAREQARGRLDALRKLLSVDQRRRLGLSSDESRTP